MWENYTLLPHSGEVLGCPGQRPEPGSPSRQGLPATSLKGQLQTLPLWPPTSQMEAPGNATSVTLGLLSSTTYIIRVTCLYPGGGSSTTTGSLTTCESSGATSVQSGPSPRRMGMWAQPSMENGGLLSPSLHPPMASIAPTMPPTPVPHPAAL